MSRSLVFFGLMKHKQKEQDAREKHFYPFLHATSTFYNILRATTVMRNQINMIQARMQDGLYSNRAKLNYL